MSVVCSTCGFENAEQARFCGGCAAPLEDRAPAREVRKTVTVVFCDVTGSTALGERLDPESLRRVMARYFEARRASSSCTTGGGRAAQVRERLERAHAA